VSSAAPRGTVTERLAGRFLGPSGVRPARGAAVAMGRGAQGNCCSPVHQPEAGCRSRRQVPRRRTRPQRPPVRLNNPRRPHVRSSQARPRAQPVEPHLPHDLGKVLRAYSIVYHVGRKSAGNSATRSRPTRSGTGSSSPFYTAPSRTESATSSPPADSPSARRAATTCSNGPRSSPQHRHCPPFRPSHAEGCGPAASKTSRGDTWRSRAELLSGLVSRPRSTPWCNRPAEDRRPAPPRPRHAAGSAVPNPAPFAELDGPLQA
jgi:hypothetical protein